MQRLAGAPNPIYPGGGSSRSPLQHLQGTITPNSLHFERHHAGIPDINPAEHKLVINGLVRQPLVFEYEDLLKYPMVSKIHFLECSGNSGALLRGGNEQLKACTGLYHVRSGLAFPCLLYWMKQEFSAKLVGLLPWEPMQPAWGAQFR